MGLYSGGHIFGLLFALPSGWAYIRRFAVCLHVFLIVPFGLNNDFRMDSYPLTTLKNYFMMGISHLLKVASP